MHSFLTVGMCCKDIKSLPGSVRSAVASPTPTLIARVISLLFAFVNRSPLCVAVLRTCSAMFSNHSRAFAAQRHTLCCSGYATSSLMRHRVSVYPQIKNQEYSSASHSQDVIAINWGSSLNMTWQQFLRKYTIWFAAQVVGEQQLQIAVKTISSIPDVDYFDSLYYDYIKRDNVSNLGYYCKDNFPVPITIEVSGDKMLW